MPSAYLLVSHGSRDPRPEVAMQQLAGMICNKELRHLQNTVNGGVASLPKCETIVDVAYLELQPEPLHEQIRQFGKRALACGCSSLKILPLFLLPGVHVMEDIPAEVTLAQKSLGEDIKIDLQAYLGSHPGLEGLLAKQMAAVNTEAWIMISHGSRRPGSRKSVEATASNLGAAVAYWAVSPSLESRVQNLVTTGYEQIAILPYFLFAGGITDAIAQLIEKVQLQFPAVNFQMVQPLGASTELADLIWDLITE
jgi:sirohydrochlorin cobaltochelatase